MALRPLSVLVPILFLLGTAAFADQPQPPDSWTEYPDVPTAEADGWTRECGLSQAIVVDADCAVGSRSVGCRATQANWCNEFGLEKPVSLAGLTALRFQQKASWAGLNFQVRLTMQPTEAEAAQGVEVKRLTWNMPTQTTWTSETFSVAEGEWSWRVDGNWQYTGFDTTLTEMVALRWFFCTYFGIAIGDRLLIDDLTLVQDASATFLPAALRCEVWPNPFNPRLQIRFQLPEADVGTVSIHDLAGHRLRLLESGPLDAGPVTLSWDGCDGRGCTLPGGEYLVVLETSRQRSTRKVTLVR